MKQSLVSRYCGDHLENGAMKSVKLTVFRAHILRCWLDCLSLPFSELSDCCLFLGCAMLGVGAVRLAWVLLQITASKDSTSGEMTKRAHAAVHVLLLITPCVSNDDTQYHFLDRCLQPCLTMQTKSQC
eukprot:5247233-Pleurochrysis_carterae.AAC.1